MTPLFDVIVRLFVAAWLASAALVNAQPATSETRRDVAALCDARAENHHLDFWLCDWDVYADGQKVAESSIQRLAGSCAILESYAQADGYSGKSINFYDPALRTWRQTWVDGIGTVSEFTGQLKDGAMLLEGRTHTRDGKEILRKMRLDATEPGRVRQYSERSGDGGRSWSTAYDFVYVRREAAPAPK
jgi:hypothetical protein